MSAEHIFLYSVWALLGLLAGGGCYAAGYCKGHWDGWREGYRRATLFGRLKDKETWAEWLHL